MSLISRRVRGFRLIDLVAAGLLVAIVLGVYLAKTIAGRERTEIAKVERQIDAERARIRLLQAEVTHLEQPGRIERLSGAYLGLAPVAAGRETTAQDLNLVASRPAEPLPQPPPPVVVVPAVVEAPPGAPAEDEAAAPAAAQADAR